MEEQTGSELVVGEAAPSPGTAGQLTAGRGSGRIGKVGFYLALLPLIGILFMVLVQPG